MENGIIPKSSWAQCNEVDEDHNLQSYWAKQSGVEISLKYISNTD